MHTVLTGEEKFALRDDHSMKVLMAPMNICRQPLTLVEALRECGVYARLFQYTKNVHDYDTDIICRTDNGKVRFDMDFILKIVEHFIESDFDIYHFWQKTFLFRYGEFMGFDLPIFKSAGKRIVHRFTGWDLRRESDDLRWNPYSAFRYGFKCDSSRLDDAARLN